MSKHTPGTWKAQKNHGDLWIRATDRYEESLLIANVYETFEEGQKEANARLIAAAPEMLEVLREAISAYSLTNYPKDHWSNKVRRLLAKIEGE